MRRLHLLFVIVVIAGLASLQACSAIGSGGPTATPTDLAHATPDKSMATPTIGFAQRPRSQGVQPLLLYSQPNTQAAVSGHIYPGDEGVVLGLDASQAWVLVQFGETVGWTPVMTLALTIAQ